jgi:folate-binding protein YgfZ
LQSENIYCNYYIQEYSITVVEGKDSVSHINRIITSDITGIKDLQNYKTLICDANGKIIDAIEISSISGQLLLLGISVNSQKTRDLIVSGIHWNEEVRIMNGDGALSIITIFGKNLARLSKALDIESSGEEKKIWEERKDLYFLNRDLINDKQVDILIQTDLVKDFIIKIENEGVELATEYSWELHRIKNGILSNNEYKHRYLPSELGLDKIVDLKKGCYPGQEIHARLESRGKVSKKIIRYSADCDLEIGTYKSNSGRKIRITSSVKNRGFAILSVKEESDIILDERASISIEDL